MRGRDTDEALSTLASAIRGSGLVAPGSKGVALLSGGPDSACLAGGLVVVVGAESVSALHLNYGLRQDSGDDEARCVALCERLGIGLEVERPALPAGNVQAAAREARYAAAERLLALRAGEWVATGHTRTDLAETVLYRLASSPGRRALLGLPARRGHVIRPLLALGREDTRRLAAEGGLPFRDDPSNADPGYARNRIRAEVLPVLRELGPAVERNIAETQAELAEEAEALERLALEALDSAGAGPGAVAVRAQDLARLDPALRRLALRALAGRVAGADVALGRERAAEVWRLAQMPEGGEVDLGGGLRAICEQGLIRLVAARDVLPEPATLPVPGCCRFGRWEVRAEVRPGPIVPAGPELATLDPAALENRLEVRAWREGDRMRPLGLDGTKSVQDLFTDAKVPRSLRHSLPVIVSGRRIAWVAGVAVSEEFKLAEDAAEAAVLTATVAE